jgi:hypothetical protein
MFDLYRLLRTELIGWFIVGVLILPGAVVTVVIDQMTLLDRAQLWVLSVTSSAVLFVALAYARESCARVLATCRSVMPPYIDSTSELL